MNRTKQAIHRPDPGVSRLLREFAPQKLHVPRGEIRGFARRWTLERPLLLSGVPAGFPSPADDYIDKNLDLNEHLVKNPAATFFVRAYGDSMKDAGIHSGDILIVDRAEEPRANSIVVAVVNGELTVKRLRKKGETLFLVPENPEFTPVEVTPEMDFEVWGVVTNVIHKL
ncbi:MAG: LexA family protein [Desulfovibrionales bacterium]